MLTSCYYVFLDLLSVKSENENEKLEGERVGLDKTHFTELFNTVNKQFWIIAKFTLDN